MKLIMESRTTHEGHTGRIRKEWETSPAEAEQSIRALREYAASDGLQLHESPDEGWMEVTLECGACVMRVSVTVTHVSFER